MSAHIPYALYRAEQVRALDKAVIEGFGIPGYTLMSRAGEAAFRLLRERWPRATRIAVFCGVGNNGGDGFVVARLAQEAGFDVQVLQVGDGARIHGDALTALEAYRAAGGEVQPFAGSVPRACSVLVDALLGTGLEREVKGEWRTAIEAINRASQGVLAIDIPSGLHADTGAILGAAVHAQHTLSFIGLKQGMFTASGRDCCGRIHFDNLGAPAGIYAKEILSAQRLAWDKLTQLLPPRPRTLHKGQCGHVLVIGGEPGFTGAVRMAAEAAARTGAGLVSIATRAVHGALLNATRPELMCHGVEGSEALEPLLRRATVVAIGPGLGAGPWAQALWARVIETPQPLVMDADALNLLAKQPCKRDDWVLTPHPGEAARMLGRSTAAIYADRFAAARALRDRFGGVAVLKGAGTLVDAADKPVGVCDAGNPGMASGGMGDVLTGIIAGLIAQGLTPDEAARAGVCLHATAADQAAADGERGLLAGDLMAPLRRLVNPGMQGHGTADLR